MQSRSVQFSADLVPLRITAPRPCSPRHRHVVAEHDEAAHVGALGHACSDSMTRRRNCPSAHLRILDTDR